MTTLVIDDEPKWLAHWAKRGADSATTVQAALVLLKVRHYDSVILNARWVASVKALIEAGARGLVVVSNRSSIGEQIQAYRAGAVDYRVKSFN